MKTLKQVKNERSEYSKLIQAVYNSLDENDFENIYNHGISGGYGNFIHYSDTIKFWRANRKQITQMLEEMAIELGEGVLEMVQGFRCLGSNYETNEIARCLYGNYSDNNDYTIYNAFAWFAAEEVLQWFCEE